MHPPSPSVPSNLLRCLRPNTLSPIAESNSKHQGQSDAESATLQLQHRAQRARCCKLNVFRSQQANEMRPSMLAAVQFTSELSPESLSAIRC